MSLCLVNRTVMNMLDVYDVDVSIYPDEVYKTAWIHKTKLEPNPPGSRSSTGPNGWGHRGPSCPCCVGHRPSGWLYCCRWWHVSTASSLCRLPPSSGRRMQMHPRWWEGSECPSHTPCLHTGRKREREMSPILFTHCLKTQRPIASSLVLACF